ncbi:MAG: GFA family protein [Burkholderiales bacterium]|nr:MAG: GFA family protein [Burkholderiales bacterium]
MATPRKTGKPADPKPVKLRPAAKPISGQCLCGAVEIETDVPVFWAWHDHSAPSRRAHGAAYASYVGCWKSKVRITKGEGEVTRFADIERKQVRHFCSRCGTPLMFERGHSPRMINLPRSLFTGRTGREVKYHVAIEQLQDWAYLGAPVAPLKGYPGVTVEKSRKRGQTPELFDPEMFEG